MRKTVVSHRGKNLSLQEADEFLRSIYEHAAVGIEQVAADGRLLMVNEALCRMLGYSRTELLSKTFDEIIHPDDRAREAALLKKMLTGQYKCYDLEKRYIHRNGSSVWAAVTSVAAGKGSGSDLYCMSIVRDITARKSANAEFRFAVESVPTAMVMVGEDGNIILVNSRTENLFGYRSEELLHEPVEILVPESFRKSHPGLRKDFLRHPQERPMGHGLDLHARRKDGTQFPVEIGLHPVEGESGRWILASIVDISARKQAEKSLRESEDKLALLLESTAEGIFGIDLDARCTFSNPACLRMLGYQNTYEVLGKNMHDLIHHTRPDGAPYPIEECPIVKALQSGEGAHIEDEALWRADGSSFHAEYWSSPQRKEGRVVGAVVAFIDITARRRAEEALKKSEEKFSKAFRESPMALTLTSAKDHRYIDVNETFERLTGYSRAEVVGRTPFELGLWAIPSERLGLVKRLLTEGRIRDVEVAVRAKDGRVRVGLASAELIEIEGEQLVLAATADITDRKRAEQALQASEERFRRFFQEAAAGMVIVSPDFRFVAANRAFCEFLGYSDKELIGRDVSSVTHPEDQAVSLQAMEQALASESGLQRLEKRYLHKNGQILWGELSTTLIRDSAGKADYFVSQIVDITARKRAEEALKKSEEKFSKAFRESPMAITLTSAKDHHYIDVNETFERLSGYSRHEALGRTPLDLGIWVDPSQRLELVRRLLAEGSIRDFEVAFHTKDGGIGVGLGSAELIEIDGEQLVLSAIVDITERKQAERALRESEERFRLVANAAPVMIWMSGPDTLCTYFNQPWLEFTGRSLEAELGNGWAESVHPDDLPQCLETYTQSLGSRVPFTMEYRLRRHDGEYRWIHDTGVPRVRPDGSFAGYIGSCVDITDRKRAEEALRTVSAKLIEAQEKERKRIARELHDDINQRLAMLAIEIQQLRDIPRLSAARIRERTEDLFKRTTEISSDVQLLSHRLHSSSLDYLGLVPAMRGFCGEFAKHQKVEVDFAHSDVPTSLPPDVGLGLFRVLQEALHNAVKHSGVRRFEARLRGVPGGIQLTIRDSGKGLDLEAAMSGKGLGLVSMRERVNLLKGTISIVSKPRCGTEITVRIPLVAGTGASQDASA